MNKEKRIYKVDSNNYILNLIIRQVSRRAGTSVSYKEESEEGTDSEDLVEVDESNAASTEPDNAETIEQILGQRMGKKGGWFMRMVQCH